MDPVTALAEALAGNRESARSYNAWVRNGGFRATVDVDPGTDLWMRGVRVATVKSVGTKWVHIHHAMSDRTFRIAPKLVTVS